MTNNVPSPSKQDSGLIAHNVLLPENGEIVFDEKSGISLDEQRNILAGINSIAEKNRTSLSGAARAGI